VVNQLAEEEPETLKNALSEVKNNLNTLAEGLSETFEVYKNTQDQIIQKIDEEIKNKQIALQKEEDKLRREFAQIEALMYNNEQLKNRLQSMVVPLSEMTKK
jgi:flagellar hook-associated protein 2